MTTPVAAVIFDCDGTLVDSVTLATEVLVAYLADLGHAVPASDVGERFACGRMSEFQADLERAVGCWKPDPGLLLHVATQLGVEPARCLVVEDAGPGVDAALAAGMRVLALCESRWSSDLVRPIRRLSEVREHVPGRRPGSPNG